MPLRTAFRSSPVLWVVVPAWLLASLYLAKVVADVHDYTLANWSAAFSPAFLVLPLCAALAAYDGGRLRTGQIRRLPLARTWLVVLLTGAAPSFLLGVVVLGFFGLWRAGWSVPPFPLLLVTALTLLAHVLAGFRLGLAVRSVVAVPLALAASYVVLVIPFTISVLWVRHLTGVYTSCCDVATTLSSRAVIAAVVMDLAVVSVVLISLARWRLVVRAVVCALVLVGAFTASASAVRLLGSEPTEARPAAAADCTSSGGATVCLWPENDGVRDALVGVLDSGRRDLAAFGIVLPEKVTEVPSQSGDGLLVGVSPAMNDTQLTGEVARALVPGLPACPEASGYSAGRLRPVLFGWFAATMGVRDESFGLAPDEASAVADVTSWSTAKQAIWVRAAVERVSVCDEKPVSLP